MRIGVSALRLSCLRITVDATFCDEIFTLSKRRGIGKVRASTYDDFILEGDKVSEMLQAFRSFIGENQMMAYLVMMADRLNLDPAMATSGLKRLMF